MSYKFQLNEDFSFQTSSYDWWQTNGLVQWAYDLIFCKSYHISKIRPHFVMGYTLTPNNT